MCGIVGMASRDAEFEPALAATMRDTMSHRGPDDAGLWAAADGRIWLGQRRLSILDLSPAGHQPMTHDSGDCRITFNGEIYNYRELKVDLAARGHQFHTGTDTEVILAAYREWGDGCVEKLNGMFAFAIHDEANRRLFLARDRAGEKPLFYWHEPGRFAFASELKALLAHPRCPRKVDRRALDYYLAFGYVPGDACILVGLHKLLPGHLLVYELTDGSMETRPYWELPSAPAADSTPVDETALLDELATLLEDSVRLRLHADVPVGVMLSGGIDSSLVAAMATRTHRAVKTFTVAFPGHGEYDESAYARQVAQALGTEHIELSAQRASVELLPLLAAQYDEPIADSSMVPTYLVSKLIREHAVVALGGDGGDELFGGYSHYHWVQQQSRLRLALPRPFRRLASFAADRVMPVGMRGRMYALALGGDSTGAAVANVNLYFDPRLRQRLLSPLVGHGFGSPPEAFRAGLCDPRLTDLQQSTRADFSSYLPDDILTKVDRASMLASLEVRAAFLDPRLIDFAFERVPDRLKMGEGTQKLLLRRLAARVLPREIVARGKRGFSIPIRQWLTGDWGRYIAGVLRESDGAVFDRGVIDELLAGQLRGMRNEQRLFSLVLFELWRKTYRVTF